MRKWISILCVFALISGTIVCPVSAQASGIVHAENAAGGESSGETNGGEEAGGEASGETDGGETDGGQEAGGESSGETDGGQEAGGESSGQEAGEESSGETDGGGEAGGEEPGGEAGEGEAGEGEEDKTDETVLPFGLPVPLLEDETVGTFEALEEAIANVPLGGAETTIEISENISLENFLTIEGKNIRLKGKKDETIKLTAQEPDGFGNTMIEVKSGATLTLENLTIDGGNGGNGGNGEDAISGPLIKNHGDFILESGLITGASGTNKDSNGGGVYNNGTFEMKGGEISGNNAYGNTAAGGGAVQTHDTFIMTGGSMTGNSAETDQGSNHGKLGVGGAIYVKAGTATITGGEITGNHAAAGGGIYVHGTGSQSDTAELYISDAVITKNEAELDGGGVWLCQTGVTESHVGDGAVVSGNWSDRAGDDYAILFEDESREVIITIPFLTLKGTPIDWYPDNKRARYRKVESKPDRLSSREIEVTEDTYLHSELEDAEVPKSASVMIAENTATTTGGGIAANGVVVFGTEQKTTTFTVEKNGTMG